MVRKKQKNTVADPDAPVSWPEVEQVMCDLVTLAARGAASPDQASGPVNGLLVKVVGVYRRRGDLTVAQVGRRKILGRDLEAYEHHLEAKEIAQLHKAGGLTEQEARDGLEGVRDDVATKADLGGGVPGEELPAAHLEEAIRYDGGPKQFADRLLRDGAVSLDSHTRKAIDAALVNQELRGHVLANLSARAVLGPGRERPTVLNYVFRMLGLFKLKECKVAIRSTFGVLPEDGPPPTKWSRLPWEEE